MLPNGNHQLEALDQPAGGGEGGTSVSATNSQGERRLACRHKAHAMMQKTTGKQREFPGGFMTDAFQLGQRHARMPFVINSLDDGILLNPTNHAQKIHHGPGIGGGRMLWQAEGGLRQGELPNRDCHSKSIAATLAHSTSKPTYLETPYAAS